MSRILQKQTNFASGELAAALDGRTDLDRYYNGGRTVLNWWPIVQGGIRRAPGTTFADELFGKTRLFAYEASATDLYLFALQNLALQVYKDDVKLQSLNVPWVDADLFETDYTQALDTCVFTHEDYAPRRLYRDSGGVFGIEDLTDTALAIHLTNIPTDPTLKRWYPGVYRVKGDYLQPTVTNEDGYYYICSQDGVSGSTEPTWAVGPVTDGGAKWTRVGSVEGIRVWTVARGFPRCCTFFQDRLVFAGSKSYPNRIWLSCSGEYFNFDTGIGLDTDAIEREILSDKLPVVQWVYPGRRLVVGTNIGEFTVAQSAPITPTVMTISKQTSIGSARVSPVDVDGAVVHLTQNRDQVRELLYTDMEQAFATKSLSLLSPAAVDGAVQLAAKAAVNYDDANLVFVVNETGVLGVLSTLRDQDFTAWVRRSFTGLAESVAAVGDRVYIVVAYQYGAGVYADGVYASDVYEESGGSSSRFLCYFDDDARLDFQVLRTEATPTTIWTGFGHLAGATVDVLVDGMYVGPMIVSAAGTLTTEWAANNVAAGIPIPTPTLTPMPVSFNGPTGNISHLLKRLIRVFLHLSGTTSLRINGEPINFREAQQNPFEALVPFSGVKEISMFGRDREATFTLTAPEPLPATILSITREVGI